MINQQKMVKARKEDYKKYNVPFFIEQRASRICDVFAINGICDPMYISNIIALRTECGDGNSKFTYKATGNEYYERHIKKLENEQVNEICDDLMGSYGGNIYKLGKSKEVLLDILTTGTTDMGKEYQLLSELISIKEGEIKEADDQWRKKYLMTAVDTLVRRAINNRFIEGDEVAVKELREGFNV